jgi:hypothetical protein
MSDDETQADRDARVALTYAQTSVKREADSPRADRTAADAVEAYAMEFLDYLDGSVPRALRAAQAACLSAATEVAHPSRWRAAMRAVELCRRAAGLPAADPAADASAADASSGAGHDDTHPRGRQHTQERTTPS